MYTGRSTTSRARRVLLALGLSAALPACGGSDDPFEKIDQRYTSIMVDLGVADRDTTRNVRNKEARTRKAKAERAKVALFRDPKVQQRIEAARSAPEGSPERVKADAYWRHMIVARSWTEEEKADETKLLGRLEEAAGGAEFSWTPTEGGEEIPLSGTWPEVSKDAEDLSETLRERLATEWITYKLRPVGPDLQELVRLRNKVAKREGFENYWELALAGQGLTPADVDQVLADLLPVVAPVNEVVAKETRDSASELGVADTWANRPLVRRHAGLERGRDEADQYFDTDLAEDRVRTAFADMGIETDGWQVYSGPTRYVRSGVYGFPIRPPEFVAIVMSQDQRWSIWQYEALAHEGGHAVWWKALGAEQVASPVLWEPVAPWFEGFSQFFERLVFEPGWTTRYVQELPAELREPLYHWRKRRASEFITDSIVETMVERRLYEDPSSLEAITRFAAETRAKLSGAPIAPQNEAGLYYDDALTSPLFWNYPAYAQNYVFSYMTEAWMFEGVSAKVGDPVANAEVGQTLRQFVVRAPIEMPFPDRLEALAPGMRTKALEKYLEVPKPEPVAEAP